MWTFITTEKSKIECKMDVTLRMNDTFVEFQTAFSIKGFRANVRNFGKFEKLDVKEQNNTTFNAITLSNSDKWYEMRVSNSTLRRPRLPCVVHFLNTIRRKGKRRQVYTQECQKICYPRQE
ncbi:hypothetical protein MTO96_041183 [Rhipicephalus appendiculatus]